MDLPREMQVSPISQGEHGSGFTTKRTQSHEAKRAMNRTALVYSFSDGMRNGLKIRMFIILAALAQPASTKPPSIVRHDSIQFIIGAIHRTLPLIFSHYIHCFLL
jgi:hypothetical protein